MKSYITTLLATLVSFQVWAEDVKILLDAKLSDQDVWTRLEKIAGGQIPDIPEDFSKITIAALSENSPESAMELAYLFHGMSRVSPSRPDLIERLLSSHSDHPQVAALQQFLDGRSVPAALELLRVADSPRSISLAYMCLAEAEYAQGDKAKAIMAATLSLAYHRTELFAEQAKFYLTGHWDSSLDFMASKQEIENQLVDVLQGAYDPKTFRNHFAMLSVLGLLSEFPYSNETLAQPVRDPIHIVIGFDDNYTYHGGVTMLSAMLSADPATRYVFHVPEDPESTSPITASHQEKLQAMTEFFPGKRFDVVFEKYEVGLLPEMLQADDWNNWPRGVLFKLYIPEFYGDHDKIMWLDSDLIVRADVSSFYNQDMQGRWIAGVRDINASRILPRLKLEEVDAYVNAGVMVFDNVALRENKNLLDNTLTSVEDEKSFFVYPEQDTFAVAFKGHIKEHGRMERHHKDHYFERSHWNWGYHKTHPTEQWDRIHRHFAYIFHLNGPSKPWRYSRSQLKWAVLPRKNDGMQNLYWVLRDMGPWPMHFGRRA